MNFAKKTTALLCAASVLFSFSVHAKELTENLFFSDFSDIGIVIDGEKLNPTDANGESVPPFIENGSTYVPLRAVAQAFDLSVGWEQDTKTVFIGEKGGQPSLNEYINIFIDGREFTARDANGSVVHPVLKNGTNYVPLRAVGEALGKTVHWDNVTRSVVIVTPLSESENAAFRGILSERLSGESLEADYSVRIQSPSGTLADFGENDLFGEESLIFPLVSEEGASSLYRASETSFGIVLDAPLLVRYASVSEEALKDFTLSKAYAEITFAENSVTEKIFIPVKHGDTTLLLTVETVVK